MTSSSLRTIGIEALRTALYDGAELALLDLREEGRFERGHLFWAHNLPLSRLELQLAQRVPRRGTRIVLVGEHAEDQLATRGAERLHALGYTDVALLAGGQAAWVAAGHPVYQGLNVPSKAFGEFVEHAYGTPHIEASELKALQDGHADLIVLDSRPLPEFKARSIPGGIDCPGAELPYRVHDAVPSPDTLIVVNCAGRTRSIIGAQSLINAGVPNKVVALKDGTMGWHLAGLRVASGESDAVSAPTSHGLARAQASADRLAKRFGVRRIDETRLAALRAESSQRALYVFDVRQPEEYAAGHREGVRNAPGGQLVQATDSYAAIRNARIVLTDDTGIRATATAAWLVQLGWPEVYVLDGGLGDAPLVHGAEHREVLGRPASVRHVDAVQLATWPAGLEGVRVIDLQDSESYRQGHLPRAWFAVRSRLPERLASLGPFETLVITSPDGALAELAAAELQSLTDKPVHALRGGTDAWTAAGLPLERGDGHLADEADDVWVKPANRRSQPEKWMRDYLTWETALVEQIRQDPDVRFKTYPA